MNVAIVNCFDTYGQRVDALYDYFKKKGDNVKVYASNFRHIEKIFIDRPSENYLLIPALKYKRNISFRRAASHIKFSNDVFDAVRHNQIDLLWVLLPPNSLAKKAIEYKNGSPKVKVVFDVIDMWPETMPLSCANKMRLVKKWKNMRNNNLIKADYVVTECNLFRDVLSKELNLSNIQTIYFSKDSIKEESASALPSDRYSLCYLGSINNIIDIQTIVDIISTMSKKKPVELHIIGDGENRRELMGKAKKAGAKVFYYGKVYDLEKKQDIMRRCHYGLNIMKKTVCVGLTMKSLDYFNNSLPIINNIKGDTWDLVERKRIGINYPDKLITAEYDYKMRARTKKFFEETFSRASFDSSMDLLLRKERNER